jgi:hypothetical protein
MSQYVCEESFFILLWTRTLYRTFCFTRKRYVLHKEIQLWTSLCLSSLWRPKRVVAQGWVRYHGMAVERSGHALGLRYYGGIFRVMGYNDVFFFFLVAHTRGSVLPFRSIGLILLSFLIRTLGRTPWTGD